MTQITRLSQIRDRHFMQQCRNLMADRSLHFDTMAEVTAMAASMPAPMYYVSYAYALKRLHEFMLTGTLRVNSAHGGAMWCEILDRTAIKAATTLLSPEEALARVLQEPASSYFISPSTAKRLYFRIKSREAARRRREAAKRNKSIQHLQS